MNSHYSDNINLENSNFGSHVPIKHALYVYLASYDSSYVTLQVIHVNYFIFIYSLKMYY